MGLSQARFRVITLFPDMIQRIFAEGVVGQAAQRGHLAIETLNPRQFTHDVHQSVDDRPFGGSDGMVMAAEPLQQALDHLRAQDPESRCIYLSPQGERLTDNLVRELAQAPNLILICGRYGGVDQRFLVRNEIREISIGDYVLSGGELAAAVLIDAVGRQLPGVLGHQDSAKNESFNDGLLEAPQFTRPREWQGLQVPEILLSGHHARIDEWRRQIAVLVTMAKRPDLISFEQLKPAERKSVAATWRDLSAADKTALGLDSFELPSERGGQGSASSFQETDPR